MKKNILLLSAIILLLVTIAPGCSGDSKKPESTPAQQENEQYQCPMKCTEEKFDKPGKCPVCGMDLEKITNS